jgi:hypothetical protein
MQVPDMLMLNMGPHVYKQEEFEVSGARANMRAISLMMHLCFGLQSWMDATVKYLEANYTGQIVYRTYPPGD